MQRPAVMTREKRPLERDGKEEDPPEEKRQKVPQLASVIVEALKVDSLQRLCSSLEPILRRVVSEEVERALAKLGPSKFGARLCCYSGRTTKTACKFDSPDCRI